MMDLKRWIAVAVMMVAGASAPVSAELVTNGSFEVPNFPIHSNPEGWVNISNSFLAGWQITGDVDLAVNGGAFGSAADGFNFVDLNGYTQGALTQTLSTVVGQVYDVTLSYTGNLFAQFDTQTALKQALVLINNQTLPNNPLTHVPTDGNGWKTYTSQFTADSTSSTLVISSFLTPGSGGIMIDNVSVKAVSHAPEPTSLALGAMGLIGAWGMSRRRRKASVETAA